MDTNIEIEKNGEEQLRMNFLSMLLDGLIDLLGKHDGYK